MPVQRFRLNSFILTLKLKPDNPETNVGAWRSPWTGPSFAAASSGSGPRSGWTGSVAPGCRRGRARRWWCKCGDRSDPSGTDFNVTLLLKAYVEVWIFKCQSIMLESVFLDFVIMRCSFLRLKKRIQNRIDIWNWWFKSWRIINWLTCGQQHRGFDNGGIFIQRPKKKNRKRKVKKVFVWFQIN